MRLMTTFVLLLTFLPLSMGETAFSANKDRVDAAVSELNALIPSVMKQTGIPGIAVAVVFEDTVVMAKGFGVRQVGKPDRVDADTVFQLASVSKPIGATVLASVFSDGKFSWDSRVQELDPSFALANPWVTQELTVRDLYAHRSGLPDHAGDLLEDMGFSRKEVLHRLRHQTPGSSFRSHYAYTNFGMTAAAVAVAKALETSWEDLSAKRLYEPLGMSSTSSRHADFLKRPNRALGHVWENDQWVQRFDRNPDAQSPAGGVSSSVKDLTQWLRLQLANGEWEGRPLADRNVLAETGHPHMLTGINPKTGAPGFYGLGWNVNYDGQGRLRLSHSGAFSLGAATAVFLVPAEQLGIVILTNAAPIGVPEAVGMTFLDLALTGKSETDWFPLFANAFANMLNAERAQMGNYSQPPQSPTPPAPLAAYTGKYESAYFGPIEVSEENESLVLRMGPKKRGYPLRHWDRDVFLYESETESLDGTSGVFFTIGSNGAAQSVVVENLNRTGQGTFTRETAQP